MHLDDDENKEGEKVVVENLLDLTHEYEYCEPGGGNVVTENSNPNDAFPNKAHLRSTEQSDLEIPMPSKQSSPLLKNPGPIEIMDQQELPHANQHLGMNIVEGSMSKQNHVTASDLQSSRLNT
jgi:hypothetical protein